MIAAAASRMRLVAAAIALSSTSELGHGISGGWLPGSAYSRGFAIRPSVSALRPSTMCSESITASKPASSASTAMRTSARRSRGGASVQFSDRTSTMRGASAISSLLP
jgi:hypothetical protein